MGEDARGTMHGKVAVVTGAAGGIGGEVVAQLSRLGAEIVAGDLDGSTISRAHEGRNVRVIAGDVRDESHRSALLEAALALGGPDYLVTAHGIVRMCNIPDVTEDLWDQVQGINAKSVFLLCQGFAEHLRSGGAIVNLSSISGKAATTVQNGPYNASKAAVMAITKTFAYYLAPNVRVNCVCPGIIDTDMRMEALSGLAEATGMSVDELVEAREGSIPMARVGEPSDVASVICFLLSDDARYMTGQAVNVSGGAITY